MAPAHVIDVQQAIEAAQVDKGAKTCKALDDALHRVANLRVLEEGIAALINLFLHKLAPVEDYVDLFI
jgi:hypothetical protein